MFYIIYSNHQKVGNTKKVEKVASLLITVHCSHVSTHCMDIIICIYKWPMRRGVCGCPFDNSRPCRPQPCPLCPLCPLLSYPVIAGKGRVTLWHSSCIEGCPRRLKLSPPQTILRHPKTYPSSFAILHSTLHCATGVFFSILIKLLW